MTDPVLHARTDLITRAALTCGQNLSVSFRASRLYHIPLARNPVRHDQTPSLWITPDVLKGYLARSYVSTEQTTRHTIPLFQA